MTPGGDDAGIRLLVYRWAHTSVAPTPAIELRVTHDPDALPVWQLQLELQEACAAMLRALTQENS